MKSIGLPQALNTKTKMIVFRALIYIILNTCHLARDVSIDKQSLQLNGRIKLRTNV